MPAISKRSYVSRARRTRPFRAVVSTRSFAPKAGTVMYRKGPYSNGSTRKMRRIAQQVVSRSKETFHKDYSFGKVELYHNTYTSNNLFTLNSTSSMPSQGDGDSNRTGNDLMRRGFFINAMFLCKADRLNTKFRVFIFQVSKGYDTSVGSNLWDPVTGNFLIDPIDKDRVKILYDKIHGYKNINPGVSTTGKEVTFFRKFYVKAPKHLKFYDDGAQDNNDPYDLYAYVIAYDSYGSLTTDNIGSVQLWSRMYWKEM